MFSILLLQSAAPPIGTALLPSTADLSHSVCGAFHGASEGLTASRMSPVWRCPPWPYDRSIAETSVVGVARVRSMSQGCWGVGYRQWTCLPPMATVPGRRRAVGCGGLLWRPEGRGGAATTGEHGRGERTCSTTWQPAQASCSGWMRSRTVRFSWADPHMSRACWA